MKIIVFTICFCLISSFTYAQFGPEQLISIEAEGPVSIVVADLDGDTFPDVLTGARFTNEVAWFKNTDGQGTFGAIQPITPSDETTRVHSADLDGDNDLDILIASNFLDRFYWQENLDGLGTFGTQQVIDNNADSAFDAIAVDIDGDGDLDIVGAISNSQSAVWYENLDGMGTFGSRKTISFILPGCRSVFAGDIDNDGDLDVVANSSGDATISWFENLDGLGNFGPQNIVAGAALYVADVFCSDLDGDGDLDIMGATNAENKVAWHENLDGLGNFGVQRIVTEEAAICVSVFCTDLDNDGDMDVLYGATPDAGIETSEVAWSENLDGLGNFSAKKVIGNQLQFTQEVYAIDVDNDGDQDVFATSQNNNKVAWYENETILSVGQNTLDNKVSVFPVPAGSILRIVSNNIVFSNITVTDLKGAIIFTSTKNLESIDVSSYSSGVYLVTLEDANGAITVKKFVKE